MAKKENKARLEKQKLKAQEEPSFSPKVERVFKLLVRAMSWTVGVAFVAVLILPLFNSTVLDQVTTVLFRIAFTILLLFLVIELISEPVKGLLEKVLRD